ncbi:LacI family DNA-binding transcriptional regulator [Anaerobium acetethylicum]|uniref:LacI family transcriptional regulator n=1 Tax=Anaerobium acetethylicum TaxID=1619234 RepID=A0A1D3TU01_9FIRM|nr:substrate-binding domain-containing protein [Anaerobium acetethylicum]SCP97506.1 LacI family transcriptional regulator [Anaerobium acetethylicum]
MTLKEIARQAGVSISTVSRVINHSNTKVASQEVQDRIWKIVRENNYVPNSTARSLKLGTTEEYEPKRTRTIGCIFARSSDTTNDPFFTQIARSIEREAFRQGYILKYSFSAIDINNPSTFSLIANHQVNGVAVLGRFDKNLLNFIKKQYKHVVYTGLNTIDTGFDQVICDGYQASIAAVKHLYKLGHRRIGYVGEKSKELRYQGYMDTMKELGLPLNREDIVITQLSSDGGYNGMKKFLKETDSIGVTAFFCANDLTAIGAMKAIKENGLSVPYDIAIMSIDDIDTAQYVSPMLSTIHVPMDELGKMTAKILIDRIENGKNLPMKIELPFSFALRESCISREAQTKHKKPESQV